MKYPYQTKRLFVSDKTVDIFACKKSDCPVVYLNTFQQEGEHIFRALQAACSPPLSLVAISGLDWDRDMTPWEIPPIFKGDTPCSGGADDYLCILTEKIVPAAERELGSVLWRGIAGYSLAGVVRPLCPLLHRHIFKGGKRFGLSMVSAFFGLCPVASNETDPRPPVFIPRRQRKQNKEPLSENGAEKH